MACYRPLQGWRSKSLTPNGKRKIVFSPSAGFADLPVEVPCGQCIGCRLERSRQWAMRCIHESTLHDANSFITLTYAPEHMPYDFSLKVDHFQKFMKRLRKSREGQKIRYFHCGEYGDKENRPHYHAILFGADFPDRQTADLVNSPNPLYISEELMRLWPFGFSTVGDVTFESAAYVARYCVKKVTGENADAHYMVIDEQTGEVHQQRPEYVTMSRRPGVGRGWFDKYASDAYPSDFVTIRGQKMRPPKFYDSIYEIDHPRELELIKRRRIQEAGKHKENQSLDRLRVREAVASAKLRTFSQRKVE